MLRVNSVWLSDVMLIFGSRDGLCWCNISFLWIVYRYRQTSNIRRTLVGNKIIDLALLQLHLHPRLNTWLQWILLDKDSCKTKRETFNFWDLVQLVSENCCHFADYIFKLTFSNENYCIFATHVSAKWPYVQFLRQHLFKYWLGVEQAISHLLSNDNQVRCRHMASQASMG